MITVVILGATGSIGRQALEVVLKRPADFKVVGLGAGRDAAALEQLAAAASCQHTALGSDGAVGLATRPEADVVLNAVVGADGLEASIAALEAGKTLALANKESLVAAGELCLAAAQRGGGHIRPVDSEHAAIAQCLEGRRPESVSRIVLTASGGPFLRRPNLERITVEEALAHPTWAMGRKITIDSATLMNKGLEVIEAHHLFGFDFDDIGVLVHPQSLVHGIIELRDGSSVMQAAPADMRIPIQAALSNERMPMAPPVDLAAATRLSFEPLDSARWPAVEVAREAGRRGGTCPAVLNAANEVAVRGFLAGALAFTDIVSVTESVLADHDRTEARDLETVLEVDSWARRRAQKVISQRALADG